MTEPQEQEGTGLPWQDKQMLYFIKEGYTYQEIGRNLRIKTGEAHRRGSEARRHFAELQHIPLETLHLDKYKNHPGRGPHISNTEREMLDAFLRKEMVQLPADFTDQVLQPTLSNLGCNLLNLLDSAISSVSISPIISKGVLNVGYSVFKKWF